MSRIKRLAFARCGRRFSIHQPGRVVLGDFAQEVLSLTGAVEMWDGMEIGMVVVVDTFAFPIIGRVVAYDDTGVTLRDSVRVLYDGRHGQYSQGADKIPANAEIELTYPLYRVSADFVGGWGPYPGGVIPAPQ